MYNIEVYLVKNIIFWKKYVSRHSDCDFICQDFQIQKSFSIPAKSGTQRKGGKVKHFYRQKEFNNGVIVGVFSNIWNILLQITDETDTDRPTPICVGNCDSFYVLCNYLAHIV